MLHLKNIKIDDRTVSADFYPEDSKIAGHIKVDWRNKKILQYDSVDDYGDMYLAHSMWPLIKMAESGETDKERLVMWY